VRQHLIHRVLVEQPAVQRLRLDAVRDVALFIPLQRIPLVLLVRREVIVADAFALEPERHGYRAERHEETVAHRFLERIRIGRHAVLQLEQAVRVAIDFVLRCRGQSDEQ
jgi:hypothetical protein